MSILVFENKELQVIKDEQGEWFTVKDIGTVLGYHNHKKILDLYYSNKDEFINIESAAPPIQGSGTKVINTYENGIPNKQRLFNLRGMLLLVTLSRTETGKKFREFILDILTGEKPLLSSQYNFLKKYFYDKEPKVKAYLRYNDMGLSDTEIMQLLKINAVEIGKIRSTLHSLGEDLKCAITPVYAQQNKDIRLVKLWNVDMNKLEYVGSYKDYAKKHKTTVRAAKDLFTSLKIEGKLVKLQGKNYCVMM